MENSIFKEGQKSTIIAGLVTVFFAGAKAVIGVISGSIVLLADAVHSAADSFSTFAAFFGLSIAKKKPTEKFPYGFYKAENLAALVISGLILFAGYSIVKESIDKIFTEYQLNLPLLAVSVAVLDGIFMAAVGTYEVRVGKKINSQSLIADGRESRMHLLSSAVVLIGLISALIGIPYLEGAAGILISLFIFHAGFESAKDSIFSLMDVSPSKEIEEKIKKILKGISGLRDFSNLKLRRSGPFVFGEVEGKIRKNVNVERASEISAGIEREIKKKVPSIDSFKVSIQPYQVQKQKICVPVKEDKGLDSNLSDHFGRAQVFFFAELDKKEIKNWYLKKNRFKEKEKRAGLNSALFLVKDQIDSIITKEMGPISFHALRDNIVDIYEAKGKTAREAISIFVEGKAKPLKEPTKEKF